jgi:methylthioribose-1-phosphate isomerase
VKLTVAAGRGATHRTAMLIDGRPWRTIWPEPDGSVGVIDQTRLPHRFETVRLATAEDAAVAIRTMVVRGAPLIGATAAHGLALAMRKDPSDEHLASAGRLLAGTRPTAVNLAWAIARVTDVLRRVAPSGRADAASAEAAAICEEDVANNAAIGAHGLALVEAAAARRGAAAQVLTHCNAGWLATVDWGTALAPVYAAHEAGVPVHVFVDETRPRNQGAALTAWELGRHGVPHTVIADNAGGHLMRAGEVDIVLVGADRVAANGDVANKIGTYLKALAAADCDVPFHAAVPSPTIDFALGSGDAIPIEERSAEEVTHLEGLAEDGRAARVRLVPEGTAARNPAFDVTPARLVTGLATERGLCAATGEGIARLFPERARRAA